MLDPKRLIEQMLNGLGGAQGFAGGAAAGGLLGLLLGNKKMRKAGGGVLGYGGAAVLGALAHRAYRGHGCGGEGGRPC